MQSTLTYPGGPRPRLVAGLAVSLLLHAVLLLLLRAPSAPPPSDERRWAQPLTVLLVPPKVVPEPIRAPEPKAEPKPRRVQASARPAPEADTPATRPAPAPITVTQEEATAAAAPAPTPAQEEPRFDQEAARKSARGMYDAVKPPVTNWAAEKLNKDKEWKETKFERFGKAVANSAREDCKTAHASAGLLAPLFMLADKKDSGCKF
ncbi:hypothetical protein IP91_04452 [Pseudoduganella lurida]|uniref:Uncharacterized protein n=1 Tax=Pseudoduganella lurida TaxID=1036180 RepID=A0A562QZ48_9BURK|nr:hypothetical protein [Pseudoduganella lurida]TWI61853.1 hypothetical protein IP91_04452 [Pseudoduganella lurida]